jgi:hypothetical protein
MEMPVSSRRQCAAAEKIDARIVIGDAPRGNSRDEKRAVAEFVVARGRRLR